MKQKETDKKTTAAIGRKVRECVGLIAYIAIIVMLTFLVIHYVGQRTRVKGSSMEPSLSEGDNLIVDKLSYRFHEPERFDVVVFPDENEEGKYYIKRVIGLPGEHVQIDEKGYIFVNGEELKESYGLEIIKSAGLAEQGIDLGADEYFVLGDNRNNSRDSRGEEIGNVHRDDIVGRAWLRIYPFDRIGFVRHG